MKALVVEGGAMRGIFASGVLDGFMEYNYRPYDLAIGVSAGSSNLIGYLSDQPRRSVQVITQIATDKRFFNPGRFLRGGDLIDVKWLIEESNRCFPVDTDTLFSSTPMLAAATNIATGEADYYRLSSDNINQVVEASCALPIAYKSTPCFSGGCYTDGGVADSIPVREAYRRGAREITVILSHPMSYVMPRTRSPWIMKRLFARYPQVADALVKRADNYNASLDFIRNPPEGTTINVIAPPEDFAVKRLTMKRPILEQGYQMGLSAGREHVSQYQTIVEPGVLAQQACL